MPKKEKKSLSPRSKKAVQFFILIIGILLPVFIFTGCKSFTCTWCGYSNTYTPFFSSGTESGITYDSCIGPAAVVNCGLNTFLWPTECMTVKFRPDNGEDIVTGNVCYYDSFGCIDGKNSMSAGRYSMSFNCGTCGICRACGVCGLCTDYREDVYSDKTVAYDGISCNKEETDPRNYNDLLPRQYPRGCCGVITDEDGEG